MGRMNKDWERKRDKEMEGVGDHGKEGDKESEQDRERMRGV